MKTLILTLALAASLGAQTARRYSATTGDVVLTAAATQLTVQQPAMPYGAQIKLESAMVYCTVPCAIAQAQNGAAATATATGAIALIPQGAAAAANAFASSNVGAGTAVPGIIHASAGQTVTLDLSKLWMGNTGPNTNYTVAVAAITGTANITMIWSEI